METTDDWFCEAVWPGEFERGDFDTTDIVAGSGGRIRDGQTIFVSAGSTVDRLQSFTRLDEVLISNSICCLLAWLDGILDPSYPHYHHDFSTINKGLSHYKRYVDSSAGQIELVYFDNLLWDGHKLVRKAKVQTAPAFTSFTVYQDYLETNMHALVNNASATSRRQRIRPLCTMSNGYDSSTVAVIARNGGNCREALTFDVDRQGVDDSGMIIAKYLEMNCTVIHRDRWRTLDRSGIGFIAGSPGGSDVLFAGAEPWLASTVLFTGFHGDGVWSKKTKIANGPIADLARVDGSGRSLTEYRLWANFIHCPVPFWGVRRVRDLMAISESKEMEPWDFSAPGSDTRPICRRILEEAGVPRDAFGIGKRGVSVQFHRPENFLTPTDFADYCAWLKEKRRAWIAQGSFPPIPVIARGIDRTLFSSIRLCNGIVSLVPHYSFLFPVRSLFGKIIRRLQLIRNGKEAPFYLRRYTYPWAIERGKKHYAVPSKEQT